MAKMSNNQCLTVAERHCATWPGNVRVLLNMEKNVLDFQDFQQKLSFIRIFVATTIQSPIITVFL